jgi:hypothetical protein
LFQLRQDEPKDVNGKEWLTGKAFCHKDESGGSHELDLPAIGLAKRAAEVDGAPILGGPAAVVLGFRLPLQFPGVLESAAINQRSAQGNRFQFITPLGEYGDRREDCHDGCCSGCWPCSLTWKHVRSCFSLPWRMLLMWGLMIPTSLCTSETTLDMRIRGRKCSQKNFFLPMNYPWNYPKELTWARGYWRLYLDGHTWVRQT